MNEEEPEESVGYGRGLQEIVGYKMKLNLEDMRGWCLGRRGEALSSKAVHTRCIVLPLQQGQKCQASFCGERSKSCFST